MSNLININVIIADRPYPLKVKPEEEAVIRKAAKLINEKIRGYQNQYGAKDKQDYMAMCLLMFAVQNQKNESKIIIKDNSFAQRLNELDKILTEFVENDRWKSPA